MPHRKDIDPVELRDILAHVFLVNVDHEARPPGFRYRLVGTALEDQARTRLTGKTVTPPEPANALGSQHSAYIECVERRAPFYHFSELQTGTSPQPSSFERLVLPLTNDGESVDVLIGVAEFRNLILRREL